MAKNKVTVATHIRLCFHCGDFTPGLAPGHTDSEDCRFRWLEQYVRQPSGVTVFQLHCVVHCPKSMSTRQATEDELIDIDFALAKGGEKIVHKETQAGRSGRGDDPFAGRNET